MSPAPSHARADGGPGRAAHRTALRRAERLVYHTAVRNKLTAQQNEILALRAQLDRPSGHAPDPASSTTHVLDEREQALLAGPMLVKSGGATGGRV